MACNTCQRTNPIPTCTETLLLGKITLFDNPVFIFVQNETTGYLHRQMVTSGPAGEVYLDMSIPDPSFYSQDFNYTLWVTNIAGNISDKELITIDSESYECFQLSFITAYSEIDGPTSYVLLNLEPII